jgi:hypothetical protein
MAAIETSKITAEERADLACTYAALLLYDAKMEISVSF